MKKLIILLLLSPLLLSAQLADVHWDIPYGGTYDDHFNTLIQSTNGQIYAVGETQSTGRGGKDGYLVILDFENGVSIKGDRPYGGAKDDAIHAIVQTFDGHFLMAGYTETGKYGKKDGWLVKIDKNGIEKQSRSFGTEGNDEFKEMILLPDGSVVIAGYWNDRKNKDIWLVHIKDFRVIGEYSIGGKTKNFDEVKGLVQTHDGGFLVVGNSAKSSRYGNGKVLLTKTDKKGNELWTKSFFDKGWQEAFDLTITQDNGFAFTGLTTEGRYGEMDFYLVKADQDGNEMWKEFYGGKDEDIAYGLTQSFDGGFMIVGSSKSYRSGARQPKAFIVQAKEGGSRIWEKPHGGDKNDKGKAIHQLHDGTFVMVGETSSKGRGGKDAWIVRFGKPDGETAGAFASGSKALGMNASNFQVNAETNDGLLRPSEQTWLSMEISNNSSTDFSNVQVRLDGQNVTDGLKVWNSNYVGNVKKKTTQILHIPVETTRKIETNDNVYNLKITSSGKTVFEEDLTIKTKKPQAAKIEIAQHQVKADDSFSETRSGDEKIWKLILQLENTGDFASEPVEVQLNCPRGIEIVGSAMNRVGSIGALIRQETAFKIVKSSTYKGNDAVINYKIFVKGSEKASRNYPISLGGIDGALVILTEPDLDETPNKTIHTTTAELPLKAKIVEGMGSSDINPKDVKIFINDVEFEGSRMGEEDLTPPKKEEDRVVRTYKNKVALQEGKNKIAIEVTLPNGKKERTQEFFVMYEPRRPNLHILSIGAEHQDLAYTGKDAQDFANAFSNQKGLFFENIFIKTLTGSDKTVGTEITGTIEELDYRFRNATASDRIQENDVLMLFVSSHGKNSSDGFKLLASDYDVRRERSTTVDFQEDVVEILNQINCKKVVLLDACHSGAADSKAVSDSEMSSALATLVAAHPGMATMTSCGRNQLSYEDQEWQNGAFTEAILEAFSGKPVTDQFGVTFSADANGNKIITLNELYNYLLRRVPGMVRGTKVDPPTEQIPFMPKNNLDLDIPIFVIE